MRFLAHRSALRQDYKRSFLTLLPSVVFFFIPLVGGARGRRQGEFSSGAGCELFEAAPRYWSFYALATSTVFRPILLAMTTSRCFLLPTPFKYIKKKKS